jgi:DNA-binding IclR family transcriptional regulator
MANMRELGRAEIFIAEGRLLDMVAAGDPVEGTLEELALAVGLPAAAVRRCLREMVQAGWIAVQAQPFERLTLRLELRTLGQRPVARDRRRGEPDAWNL